MWLLNDSWVGLTMSTEQYKIPRLKVAASFNTYHQHLLKDR